MMKYLILGTAGHVDHGKTTLVKALTGEDTDRLIEEKRRGLTIDLGFALYRDDGLEAGVIDVPGHERFLPNMLCGAGSIDLVLLVVAADEGVKPQTREHLDILDALGCQSGILVLTKTDLATPEQISVTKKNLLQECDGTFLEHAPCVCVSAKTGIGLAELRTWISRLALRLPERDKAAPFRLPVDRVFSVEGFGTVATGTLLQGTLREGEEADCIPGNHVRIRGLETHHRQIPAAVAGQRVAVNVKGGEILRGQVLAEPGTLSPSSVIDISLHMLRHTGDPLKNSERLTVFLHTGKTLCRVVLFGRDSLLPGEKGYAQLRLESPLPAEYGDKLILRRLSPAESIAGGVVLEPFPPKHKRMDPSVLEGLAVKESGSLREKAVQYFSESWTAPCNSVCEKIPYAIRRDFRKAVEACAHDGLLCDVGEGYFLHPSVSEILQHKLQEVLETYHTAYPLRPGCAAKELAGKFLSGDSAGPVLLRYFAREGILEKKGSFYRLPGFRPQNGRSHKLRDRVEKLYRDSGFSPPPLSELPARCGATEKEIREVLHSMRMEGVLVSPSPSVTCLQQTLDLALALARDYASQHGSITIAQLRTLLGSSRKYAQAFLEYWDAQGIFQRSGDVHLLR